MMLWEKIENTCTKNVQVIEIKVYLNYDNK